jgi:hypothetical protein
VKKQSIPAPIAISVLFSPRKKKGERKGREKHVLTQAVNPLNSSSSESSRILSSCPYEIDAGGVVPPCRRAARKTPRNRNQISAVQIMQDFIQCPKSRRLCRGSLLLDSRLSLSFCQVVWDDVISSSRCLRGCKL